VGTDDGKEGRAGGSGSGDNVTTSPTAAGAFGGGGEGGRGGNALYIAGEAGNLRPCRRNSREEGNSLISSTSRASARFGRRARLRVLR
jgi:hypothetical protein